MSVEFDPKPESDATPTAPSQILTPRPVPFSAASAAHTLDSRYCYVERRPDAEGTSRASGDTVIDRWDVRATTRRALASGDSVPTVSSSLLATVFLPFSSSLFLPFASGDMHFFVCFPTCYSISTVYPISYITSNNRPIITHLWRSARLHYCIPSVLKSFWVWSNPLKNKLVIYMIVWLLMKYIFVVNLFGDINILILFFCKRG